MDAYVGRDVDSSKSTSGYIYTIGGAAVSWMSRLLKCVSLSFTEAEYVVIDESGKEMILLADYLEEFGKKQSEKILYSDSQSAIQLVKIQSIIRRQSTSKGDTISLAGQWRKVICAWRR